MLYTIYGIQWIVEEGTPRDTRTVLFIVVPYSEVHNDMERTKLLSLFVGSERLYIFTSPSWKCRSDSHFIRAIFHSICISFLHPHLPSLPLSPLFHLLPTTTVRHHFRSPADKVAVTRPCQRFCLRRVCRHRERPEGSPIRAHRAKREDCVRVATQREGRRRKDSAEAGRLSGTYVFDFFVQLLNKGLCERVLYSYSVP